MKKRKKKKRRAERGRTREEGERKRERGTTTGDDACTHVRAQNLISSSARRPSRRPPRPRASPFTVAKKRARARALGGNPGVSDIEVSVSFYFFVLLHPSRRRIRSYIEIVSDISTLSFFRSRLVKYRRRVRRCRGVGGERRKRIGARREEVGRTAEEEGRRGARETVCIKARSQARFLRPRDLFETKSSAACNDRASRSLGVASLLPTRLANSISSNAKRRRRRRKTTTRMRSLSRREHASR